MKTIIMLVAGLLTQQIAQAQGTLTYLSNLDQSTAGSHAVGSDLWLACGFQTGTNSGGYFFDSIQLGMTDATGSPTGFAVMIYTAIGGVNFIPGSSLSALDGSTSPTTTGVYTYAPVSRFTLSPSTAYFIVLTSGTLTAAGAYEWNYADTYSYNKSDGWQAPLGVSAVYNYQSSNGSSWSLIGGPSQFAINAIAVPETSMQWLLLLGSGILFYVRRNFRR